MSKKKTSGIRLVCLGSSAVQVTGSCWLLEFRKDDGELSRQIIECGLPQGDSTILESYNSMQRQTNAVLSYIPTVENVFLCHPHVDHTGLVPLFNSSNGFKGKILGSKQCLEITKELLKDCCYVHRKNVDYLKSKGKKKKLIYTEPQLYDCLSYFEWTAVDGEPVDINSNLKVIFRPNSHTVGSHNITFLVKEYNQNRWKSITYTSDMGSQINRDLTPYLTEQSIPIKGNILISEATYSTSDRAMSRNMALADREDLLTIIKEAMLNERRVLLPVFAFSKAQTIATFLYDNLKDVNWFNEGDFDIIMDGVLMNNINMVYSRVLEGSDKEHFDEVMQWKKLIKFKEYGQTLNYLKTHKPGVILASSGFLENGKIGLYLPQIVGCSKDVIVINGYCSQSNEGSLAYKLLDSKQKTITFNVEGEKRTVLKRAKIYQQKSWSSHITNQELKDLFASVNYDKIIIHHLDEDNKETFVEECKDYILSKNKTTPLVAVGKHAIEFIL